MLKFMLGRCSGKQIAPAVYRHRFAVTKLSTTSNQLQQDRLTLSEQRDGVRYITLNNAKRRNALSTALMDSIIENMTHDIDDVHVIVLRAVGSVFSAGHDMTEVTHERGEQYHKEVFKKCETMMKLVQDIPVPVIAQVDGMATAAGCQLVASCDIVIASENSKFATPGVNVGIFCSTPAVPIVRAVPRKIAAEMLFTGRPISAQEACQHGLVSRVVPSNELEQVTEEMARVIRGTSRSISALGKACLYQQIDMSRDEAYKLAGDTMVKNLTLRDSQEGIKAFLEKRKPMYSNTDEKM